MATDIEEVLLALQLGDSFFPSGATSFSWGIETLRAENHLTDAASVERYIEGQLTHRWATFERPALIAAYRANGNLARVVEVDRFVDAATLAREAREGGRRIGAALLKVHEGLGTPGAQEYRARVMQGEAPGQMVAVQGLIGAALNMSEDTACALSAYGLAVGMIGAALRVGLLGHMEGQRILQRIRLHIAKMPNQLAALEDITAYTPAAEIAIMKHETGSGRLFAN